MNEAIPDSERRTRQILLTSTRFGRLRLRLTLALRRASWAIHQHGARLAKRILDLSVASVALVLAAPAMVAIALLIKRDGGPVFFRQTRVGLGGRHFAMWKFRSMCVDAEARLAALLDQNQKAGGITFKMDNDPRITPIGRLIRRTSLDELPQIFNVLCGEMSIVGPRPPLPREVALYALPDRRRLLATPGITCLWQIGEREGRLFEVGNRNMIDFPEQVRLDVRYIEEQSLIRDIWIILKTPPAMLLGR